MDAYEKVGYACLGLVAVLYLLAMQGAAELLVYGTAVKLQRKTGP